MKSLAMAIGDWEDMFRVLRMPSLRFFVMGDVSHHIPSEGDVFASSGRPDSLESGFPVAHADADQSKNSPRPKKARAPSASTGLPPTSGILDFSSAENYCGLPVIPKRLSAAIGDSDARHGRYLASIDQSKNAP